MQQLEGKTMSIPILKSRIKEMKEGLEKVDNLDPSMNNLHQRIFELKMSLTNVDEEIQKTNILTKSNIQKMSTLIRLKDSYLTELKNLEMLL